MYVTENIENRMLFLTFLSNLNNSHTYIFLMECATYSQQLYSKVGGCQSMPISVGMHQSAPYLWLTVLLYAKGAQCQTLVACVSEDGDIIALLCWYVKQVHK